MKVSSDFLVVAGLVLFEFNLPSPPSQLTIESIVATIHQQFELTSTKDNYVARPPPQKRQLFKLDAQHPASVSTPNCSRPTTPNPETMEYFNKGKDRAKGKNGSSKNIFARLDSQMPLAVSHLARVPTDDWVRSFECVPLFGSVMVNQVRASTSPGTSTPLRCSHLVGPFLSGRVMIELISARSSSSMSPIYYLLVKSMLCPSLHPLALPL